MVEQPVGTSGEPKPLAFGFRVAVASEGQKVVDALHELLDVLKRSSGRSQIRTLQP